MSAIEYAKLCCDTMIRKFEAKDLPPVSRFHYHAGVFLSGMERCYLQCREETYNEYIKSYLDAYVDGDGNLHHANFEEFDDLQPCTLMYRFYNNEPRYKKVLDKIVPLFLKWNTNPLGGLWHKDSCPNQMWLDSLYMNGPLGLRYGLLTNQNEYIKLIHTQLKLMWDYMRDDKTGLLYHAWDYDKKESWANSETGCSSQIWGRALGWYIVASVDLSEFLNDNPLAGDFTSYAQQLVKSVLKFQDEKTGMWYQVVDRIDDPKNWIETSCSCLFLYGICNLLRRGLIDQKYMASADKAYNGIIQKKTHMRDNDLIISDICIGTGVGDYNFYLNRPTTENDLHGTGAFLLMCTEYEKLKNQMNNSKCE